MSHITTIAVQIRDLDCLELAARRCGITLHRNQKQFRYFAGTMHACDHLIHLSDTAYEIGVIAVGTSGEFSLSFDSYANGLGMMDHVGADCTRLMQAYAIEVALKEVAVFVAQGWAVTEEVQANGDVQVRLTHGASGWA